MSPPVPRYPVEMIDVFRLRSGQRVLLRPILPQDLELIRPFFDAQSPESRYNRFFNPMRAFPAGLLERLTHVDHHSHVALIAETLSGARETIIAEARYALKEDGESGEVAVAVADAFQDQGIGGILLSRLACIAARRGLVRLTGETLATNERMLALAHSAGFTLRRDPEVAHVVLLTRGLEPLASERPCGEAVAGMERFAA